MEDVLSPADQEMMVSSLLEIAVGQTAETARQFLQATSWKLEEAIPLFYVGNEGGSVAPSSYLPPEENATSLADQTSSGVGQDIPKELWGQGSRDDVHPPLPVVRGALYNDAMSYGAIDA